MNIELIHADVKSLESRIQTRREVSLFWLELLQKDTTGILVDLMVLKKRYRGQGVGSNILTQVKNLAIKWNLPIFLHPTGLDGNTNQQSKNFYLKNGFRYFDSEFYVWKPTYE